MEYSLSSKLRFLEIDNRMFAYSKAYGNLASLSADQYDFLLNFREAYTKSKANKSLLKKFIELQYITPLKDEYLPLKEKRDIFLTPSNSINNFKGLILKITDACNFRCKYCIDRSGTSRKETMKPEVALRAIDLFLNFCVRYKKLRSSKVGIGFNGGEPLLGFPVIMQCINFIKEHYGTKAIDFDINTNASLIDNKIARFLKVHKFSIKTSMDGFRNFNDSQRQFRLRRISAFDQTLRGIYTLKKVNHIFDVAIIAVMTENNIDKIDRAFLEFVRNDLGIKRLVIEPDISRALSIPPAELAQKIFAIKKMADNLGKFDIAGQWSTPFYNLVKANPHEIPNYCSSMSGLSFNIFPNGDVRFCNYLDSSFTITNISKISHFEEIFEHKSFKHTIYENFGGLKSACRNCSINGLCKGGCFVISVNEKKTKDTKVKKYNCEFLRAMTDLLIKNFVMSYN